MEKCSCYDVTQASSIDRASGTVTTVEYTRCLGTKECDSCNCGGDPLKCDFYPEKRKVEKKINTAEMWTAAQKNGKWYVCNDTLYHKGNGFVAKDDLKPWFNERENFGLYDVDKFMNSEWEEYPSVMTKSEAEEKFGIKIVGD